MTVRGKEYEVEFLAADGDARVVSVNGTPYRVTVRGSRAVTPPPVSRPATDPAPATAARVLKP